MNEKAIPISFTDFDLINNPLLNKGTAFSEKEREEFMLHGLLPPQVASMDEQRMRAYNAFKNRGTPLEKYINLRSLQDSNETLFYNLLIHHIEELMPFVYTPVVGEGCIHFSHIYRRPRGVFISFPNRNAHASSTLITQA